MNKLSEIKIGKYTHFKDKSYELIDVATVVNGLEELKNVGKYRVLGMAKDTETDNLMTYCIGGGYNMFFLYTEAENISGEYCIYAPLDGGPYLYCREYNDFFTTTDQEGRAIKDRQDNVTGQSVRFEYIGEL